MKKSQQPNFIKIYNDIIIKKYPEKMEICRPILSKKKLSVLDIIKINNLIFENNDKEMNAVNQKYRSYDKATICEILEHQKKNNLNNTQLAAKFKLSRNTVTKWKKLFLIQ